MLTYDFAGRKLSLSDPDMGAWSYSYDAIGNLVRQTDAKGQRTCLYYDAINRLTGKIYQSGDTCPSSPTLAVSYTYDDYDPANAQYGRGYRTGMTDSSGSTTWRYNTRGLVNRETKVITGVGTFLTQWTFNKALAVSSMTYPLDNAGNAGETVSFTYHPQLLLNAVTGSATYVQSTGYDSSGRTVTRTLGSNVLVNAYVYNPWTAQGARLKTIKSGTPSDLTSLQSLEYNYDPVGNINWIKDYKAGGTQTQTFGYDALNRLTSAVASGGVGGTYATESYTYNTSTGNLASKTGLGAYSYMDSAHKHAVTHLGGVQKYWYDANGNMTRRIVGADTFDLTYDQENHLAGVSGGTTASFVYDGDGKRVKGTVSGVTTVYIGNHFEWTGSASTMKKYYYAGGARVAMRTGSTLSFLLTDHLGSTAITASSSGALSAELRYKPWGETRYTYGATPTDFRYTGQRYETLLGLHDYGARWYDSLLGRWLQPDSIVPLESQGVQAWDRFAYANNNPVRYNDPSGHCLILCTALIGGAIGAIVGAVGYTAYTAISGTEFNTSHMLLAAGGGAAAGALIGTGVGIAAGMSSAAATTAAVTGGGAATTATTTVLNATGGDPTDEIKAATQAAQGASPAMARTLGQAGESISGIFKNTQRIDSLTGTAQYRIPDQLLRSQRLISEVKNVAQLSLTNQIKDYSAIAQQEVYTFELWVRETTKLSQPLQKLIDNGLIILRHLEPK